MPFSIKVNGITVQVLGTHFNINGYKDEAAIRTTLIEGSVRIVTSAQALLLKPGQQAVAAKELLRADQNTDLEEVLAWKNGLFNFKNAGIKTVMRQLSRGYDVDVKYTAAVPGRNFSGELERNLTLNQVLEILGDMEVHFKLEGRTLTVMP